MYRTLRFHNKYFMNRFDKKTNFNGTCHFEFVYLYNDIFITHMHLQMVEIKLIYKKCHGQLVFFLSFFFFSLIYTSYHVTWSSRPAGQVRR